MRQIVGDFIVERMYAWGVRNIFGHRVVSRKLSDEFGYASRPQDPGASHLIAGLDDARLDLMRC